MRETTLLTDLYQLTMANGYWECGRAQDEAVFHLFFRRAPFGGDAALACGMGPVAEYLDALNFSQEDIDYLAGLRGADGRALFSDGFLGLLGSPSWRLEVAAVPEGEVVYAQEPLLRVRGPLWQCQLVESALLNLVNFQTLVATKAARVCEAAAGDPVLEFGLRRAQGVDGALAASRAAHIGGCEATSNALAGKRFGIPVCGTHAHSWVMAFESERAAFEAYAEAMPNNTVFLVDTYDTRKGIDRAIDCALRLREKGSEMLGLRLDSGDLAALSKLARARLDQAGFPGAKVVASGDLDEHEIAELKRAGARIDTWGVGTRLVTAYDQPALGGVYKLGALRTDGAWKWASKGTDEAAKASLPGILGVRRARDRDVIFHSEQPAADDLLQPLPRGEAIAEVRARAMRNWAARKPGWRVEIEPWILKTREALLASRA